MNQNDLQEFNRLEKLLNENVISPIDFWQRIKELKSIQTGELNKIQNRLFTLEAKPYTANFDPLARQKYNFAEEIVLTPAQSVMEAVERMKNIPLPQIPIVQTSYNDPATHSHYIEPRTMGEKMLKKLGYVESVDEYDIMIMGNLPKNERNFERMRAQSIDYIDFLKVNGEIHFTSYLTRKSYNVYGKGSENEPKPVTKNELEAIIQIITEWMD